MWSSYPATPQRPALHPWLFTNSSSFNWHLVNSTPLQDGSVLLDDPPDVNSDDVREGRGASRPPPLSINYSSSVMVVVTVMLIIMVIATAFGNFLVGLALFRYRSLRTVSNILIGNLALSDFLLATTILPLSTVNECLGRWIFGQTMCNLWLSLDVLYCTASIWNLCVIAFDRYTATLYPMWYREKRSIKQAVMYVVLVWIISLSICVPPVLGWGELEQNYVYDNATDVYKCVLYQSPGYVLYSACGSFYIPFVVTFFMYVRIFSILRQRMKNMKKAREMSKQAALKSRRHGIASLQHITREIMQKGREERLVTSSALTDLTTTYLEDGYDLKRKVIYTAVDSDENLCPKSLSCLTDQEVNTAVQDDTLSGSEEQCMKGTCHTVAMDNKVVEDLIYLGKEATEPGQDIEQNITNRYPSVASKPNNWGVQNSHVSSGGALSFSAKNSDNSESSSIIGNPTSNSCHSGMDNESFPESRSLQHIDTDIKEDRFPLSDCHNNIGVPVKTRFSGRTYKSVDSNDYNPIVSGHTSTIHLSDSPLHSVTFVSMNPTNDSSSTSKCNSNISSSVSQSNIQNLNSPTDSTTVKHRGKTPGWESPSGSMTSASTRLIARTPYSEFVVKSSPVVEKRTASPKAPITKSQSLSVHRRPRLASRWYRGPSAGAQSTSTAGGSSLQTSAATSETRLHRHFIKRELRATLRMSIIILLFCCMWIGFFVIYVIRGWCSPKACRLPRELEAFFFWLGYSNSSLNPILYTLFNDDFRRAFHLILFNRSTNRQLPMRTFRRTI